MPFTTHADNPLMGKIICAECGHTFVRKKNYKDSYKLICKGSIGAILCAGTAKSSRRLQRTSIR